jgi:hypothetical protein
MILVQPELDILSTMKWDMFFRIVQMDTRKLWLSLLMIKIFLWIALLTYVIKRE